MNSLTFSRQTNGDGAERVYTLPARFEVCERCEGHGTHLHPEIGQHAYSAEEFRESFDDEEAGEYFRRGGRYDVRCEDCHGARVVLQVDEQAASLTHRGRRLLALYFAILDQRAAYRAERLAERRMGY